MLPSDVSDRVPLAVVSTLVGAAALALAPGRSQLTALLTLPLLCFCPGYVTVRALLPSGSQESTDGRVAVVALSAAGSLCLSILVGFALGLTPLGLTRASFALGVAGVTGLLGAVAVSRRRDSVSWRTDDREGTEPVSTSRRGAMVNGVGAVGVVVGGATAVKLLVAPPEGERYTEFGLLSETDDGEYVADEYPTTYRTGEARPIVVSIGNEERRRTSYTVVVELQRLAGEGGVVERGELARFEATVPAGESRRERLALEPTMTGEELRMAFFLYRGEAPDQPARSSAYRRLHLWVSVVEPGR